MRTFSNRSSRSKAGHLLTTIGLLSALALSGCSAAGTPEQSVSGQSEDSAEPTAGGILRYGTKDGPGNGGLDPFVATVYSSTAFFPQLYEPLIVKNDDGEYEPLLASSWEQPDEQTFDFVIRDDIKFADGTELTTDDVIWNFTYAKDNSPQSRAISLETLESVEDIGDNTVRFHFSEPNPGFLPTLADRSYGFYIVDKEWYEGASEQERQTASNGTGPFTLEEWVPGVEVRLAKNENYWDPEKPHLDGITFRETGDENTILALLQQGELDAGWFWKPELAEQAQTAGFDLGDFQQTSTRFFFIDPEGGDGSLANIRVRQALSKAIDRDEVVTLGTNGRGAKSFTTPPAFVEVEAPTDGTPNTEYDPEGAAELLKEAGVTNPTFTLSYGADTADESILVLIKDQVSKAGITLNLNPVPYEEIQDSFTTGAPYSSELILVQDVIGSDPAASFGWWLQDGANTDTWEGKADAKEAKDLLAQIDSNADPETRLEQINQLNEVLSRDALALTPFATPLNYQVWSPKVHGYLTDPGDSRYHLKDAWLES